MKKEPQYTLNSKDIAVMLYIDSQETGDHFHRTYLQELNFPRTRYLNAPFYTDYHITIGYLENIHVSHIEELSQQITRDLSHRIDLNQIVFKFGMPTLLGLPRRPFIAIMPENTNEFCKYNQIVFESIQSFNKKSYQLDRHTLPNFYLPHINLYAQVNKHIESKNLESTFKLLWEKLQGKNIPLTKIKIH